MNKNWLLQLTVLIFEPSVFGEKLGTPPHVERLKMNKGVMMILMLMLTSTVAQNDSEGWSRKIIVRAGI